MCGMNSPHRHTPQKAARQPWKESAFVPTLSGACSGIIQEGQGTGWSAECSAWPGTHRGAAEKAWELDPDSNLTPDKSQPSPVPALETFRNEDAGLTCKAPTSQRSNSQRK